MKKKPNEAGRGNYYWSLRKERRKRPKERKGKEVKK